MSLGRISIIATALFLASGCAMLMNSATRRMAATAEFFSATLEEVPA